MSAAEEADEPPPAPPPTRLPRRRGALTEGERDAHRTAAARADATIHRLPLAPPEPRHLPATRADCEDGVRPCPYVSCRHHLFLDVTLAGGIHVNLPHLLDRDGTPRLEDMHETCALDVAEQGGIPLEVAGVYLNVTRERVRQLEAKGLARLRKRQRFGELDELDPDEEDESEAT